MAYQLAKQWLLSASIDFAGLAKDCNLHIYPTALHGQGNSARFVPIYWVFWTKGSEGHGSIASVEMFSPSKTLLQLRVEDSKYILRKAINFKNLSVLLSQTNKVPVE